MSKIFYAKTPDGVVAPLQLLISHYATDESLAIRAVLAKDCEKIGKRGDPVGYLTRNLGEDRRLPEDKQFLDTYDWPDIDRFLLRNGLASSCYIYSRSGFCNYPLYKFNLDLLAEYEYHEEGEEETGTSKETEEQSEEPDEVEEYTVWIEEHICSEFKVHARDMSEAERIARECYDSGEFVVSPDYVNARLMAIAAPGSEEPSTGWFEV